MNEKHKNSWKMLAFENICCNIFKPLISPSLTLSLSAPLEKIGIAVKLLIQLTETYDKKRV
jgi:hypothetical protein